MKLYGNAVDVDPFCHELHPHRALEVLREVIVVEASDQVTLAYAVVSQKDNLYFSGAELVEAKGGGYDSSRTRRGEGGC